MNISVRRHVPRRCTYAPSPFLVPLRHFSLPHARTDRVVSTSAHETYPTLFRQAAASFVLSVTGSDILMPKFMRRWITARRQRSELHDQRWAHNAGTLRSMQSTQCRRRRLLLCPCMRACPPIPCISCLRSRESLGASSSLLASCER